MENIHVLYKDGKLIISKSLQHCDVSWYHHYVQHPGNNPLKETIGTAMFLTNIRKDVRNHVKRCQSCQTIKKQNLKYGELPNKLVIRTPWEFLCVDIIGPYTLKGKDRSQINFMCLTMIDPASSWFKIVEFSVVVIELTTLSVRNKWGTVHNPTKDVYFHKSSNHDQHFSN